MRTYNRQRGVVLVLVLWIVILLTIISYSLLFQVTVDGSVTASRKRYLEAEMLARAGVARAIVDLRNDLIFDFMEEAKVFDAEGDVWARPEEGKNRMTFERGRSGSRGTPDRYFSVRVHDEQGLLNLNRIGRASLPVIQEILEELGYEEEDAKIAAAAILDWRDTDYIPSFENAPSNDEGLAYAAIKAEDEERGRADIDDLEPLVFRNEDYLTVDELLEVYGITAEVFFGPQTPEAEHYSRFIPPPIGDRFVADRDEPLIYDADEDRGGRPLGLRDYFTVHGTGALNINTARYHVLVAMGNAAGTDGERFAERVIRNRRGGRSDNLDNDNAYQEGSELVADVEIAGVIGTMQAMGVPIDVKSSVFRIVSVGVVGDVRCTLEVLVTREMKRIVRDESLELRDRARERREQNSGRYERRTDVNDEAVIRYPFVRILQCYIH